MTRLCGECGKRAVVPLAVAGRTSPWKHFPSLPISADIEIPTCSNCGTEWIDRKTAERVDADLAKAGTALTSRAARDAIEVLGASMNQRDLESELGLSAGYLSKVKHGKETPSAALVGLLSLLAVRPVRLDEVSHVWETGCLPPRITTDSFAKFDVAANDAEPATVAG
jgi:hypothetical protein